MRDLAQWVCWRYEQRGGKTTKVPYSPRTGRRARTDDSATWTTLSAAKLAVSDYDGIGFVFTGADPFCGVDLDSCVNAETGKLEAWAKSIVDELTSYTELSPSSTGLHIIVKAKLPEGRAGNRRGRIELYDRNRFFTVTGKRLDGTPARIEERQEQLNRLHRGLFPPDASPELLRNGHGSELSDDEILTRAMTSANGDRFVRLWEGDRTDYPSASEADLALVSMLAFWTGPDEERIAALFSQSNLVREKWSREDYRKRTISRALAGMREFYGGSENGHAAMSSGPTRPALPEVTAFPTEAMPAACRPLISESEAALGCAPELVALPMLATLSSAIGTSRIVHVKGGWREWASLFACVVASPGAMKTPAAKLAKKPAFDRQRKFGRSYAEEKEEWKREVREWEVEQRAARKNGEAAPEEPGPPTMERAVASDTTVEALVSILEDNPRGLLVHKDELSGWVRSMDQYKGGRGSDRQHWLSFWSGDEVVVDRKSRMGEPIIVARPFVSLSGGIQPTMLKELGGSVEDGLMDRFLFAYPEPRRICFTDHEVSIEAEREYAALYENLSNLVLATDDHGDPNPKPLSLSSNAKRLFAQEINTLGAEVMEPGFRRRLEGAWAKLRGYLARISLVIAVCRDPDADRIEAEDVEAATKLLAYFKIHARRVHAELAAPDPLDALAGELRQFLEESDGAWKGSPTELHETLAQREVAALPDRPEELSKLVLRVGERSPVLEAKQGWRKVGGKSSRVIKLVLKTLENAVDAVVAVDPEAENRPCDNGDNSNNGNFAGQLPENRDDNVRETNTPDNRDNSDNGNPEHDPTNATDARSESEGPDDGRVRFTV